MTKTGSTPELPQLLTSSTSEERSVFLPSRLTTVASRDAVSALPSTTKALEKWSDTAWSNSKMLVSSVRLSTRVRTAASNPPERLWQRKEPLTWIGSPPKSWRRRRRPRSEHAPLPHACDSRPEPPQAPYFPLTLSPTTFNLSLQYNVSLLTLFVRVFMCC